MRKEIINPVRDRPPAEPQEKWLDLERAARVEVSSEDPNFPIEHALTFGGGSGWRAAEKGEQTIRLIFDEPRVLRRIRLEFVETALDRTQQFCLRWSQTPNAQPREIVRQQWNFSPDGSTHEVEDYRVNLSGVTTLELVVNPDLSSSGMPASLAAWRIA